MGLRLIDRILLCSLVSAKKEKKIDVGCGKGVPCVVPFLLDGRGVRVYIFCVRCRRGTVLLVG